jgi:hypothetical protein
MVVLLRDIRSNHSGNNGRSDISFYLKQACQLTIQAYQFSYRGISAGNDTHFQGSVCHYITLACAEKTEYKTSLIHNSAGVDHLELDWNPFGHEPRAVHGVRHFYFHFYYITKEEQASVIPGPQAFQKNNYYPTNYQVKYDVTKHVFRVTLSNLVKH